MSKLIIVPKNKEAEIALDYDKVESEHITEWNVSNEEFEKLWIEGVFSLINKVSGTNIDDYEDEHLNDLNLISHSLSELKKKQYSFRKMIEMFELAIYYKTSIHFYF